MGRAFSFPKTRRLRKQKEFARVFAKPEFVFSNRYFSLLAVAAGKQARLGIAVPKKRIKKAVARNRLKRIIRESFRCQQALPPVDVVVLAKAAADEAPNGVLWEALDRLWQQLRMAQAGSSASSSVATDSS